MRVLHVLDHSIPLHSGYTFRTAAILREQRALGWETFHVTSPKQGKTAAAMEDVDGLRFYRSEVPAAGPAGINEWRLIRATEARLEQLARELRPDVIHAHSPVLNAIPAIRVGRKLGIPVVYE
ncbi:MAG: glycosyltransferase, partial [Zoogloea sp.]|nr:glycosyltransferase [Zoogloea sp.]